MYIEVLPESIDNEYLNQAVKPEVMEEIRQALYNDLQAYDNMDISLKYNVHPVYDWHAEVIESILSKIETLKDILSLVRFSLKNSKLGNKILVFSLSGYFNCKGLLNGWCSCSKLCYAGKLAIRQLKKTLSNYIFYEYCKLSKDLKLLEAGIIIGVNKAVLEVNGCFSDIKAIRFNESGEIGSTQDLFYLELIYYYLKQYKPSLKAYTYSTNLNLLNLFKTSEITIRVSKGFNYSEIDSEAFRNYSVIVEPETVETAYNKAVSEGLDFYLCLGSCKTCKACTKKDTVIAFANHSNTTAKALESKIKDCQAILKDLRKL